MLNRECGQVAILSIFTLIGVWMLINEKPKAELVFTTFNSALFMRMQINKQHEEENSTTKNSLSIVQESK